nr:MAG TPA: hypothetical protein [Caudoviricetes sp.]
MRYGSIIIFCVSIKLFFVEFYFCVKNKTVQLLS